jgi:hypothetical protein
MISNTPPNTASGVTAQRQSSSMVAMGSSSLVEVPNGSRFGFVAPYESGAEWVAT